MQEIYVDHFCWEVGEVTNNVEEAEKKGLLISTASTLRQAGFSRHHVSAPQSTAYDLARRAVEKQRTHISEVSAIVYASCLPVNGNVGSESTFRESRDVKYLMDFPASHLQSDLGLNQATVIGLNQQACTGMLGSLRLARALILTEPDIKDVLCVSADRFPEGSLYEQSYNLISDGATACVVSATPSGFRLVATHAVTNGALAKASDDDTVGNFFTYGHSVVQHTLTKARLSAQDIDWVVAQNMHPAAWKILGKLLQIPEDRVWSPTLPEIGHVISGDNIINLKRLVDEDRIRSGQYALLFMAGYGLNWQCVILQKV